MFAPPCRSRSGVTTKEPTGRAAQPVASQTPLGRRTTSARIWCRVVPGGWSELTRSNPFHPSDGPLAAILPLLSLRLHFPIPLGVNLRVTPSERAVLVLTILDPQKKFLKSASLAQKHVLLTFPAWSRLRPALCADFKWPLPSKLQCIVCLGRR